MSLQEGRSRQFGAELSQSEGNLVSRPIHLAASLMALYPLTEGPIMESFIIFFKTFIRSGFGRVLNFSELLSTASTFDPTAADTGEAKLVPLERTPLSQVGAILSS